MVTRLPIVSLLNSLYVLYYAKDINNKKNFIIGLLLILLMAGTIEYTHGHILVMILIVVQAIIHDDIPQKKLESKPEECCLNMNKIVFFLGAILISMIVFFNSKLAILVLIIMRLGIYFIFYFLEKTHKEESEYIERMESYKNYYLLGAVIPILIVLWGEYESIKSPKQLANICAEFINRK